MTTIKDLEPLSFAIDSFIRSNSNFESSVIINAAVEELEQCTSLQLAFAVPLQHKILTLESSLKWVFFLTNIISNLTSTEADAEVDAEADAEDAKLKEFDDFNSNEALKLIASVYDIGVQETVLCHIDEDSDSESESESESEAESVD